jgi:hypothetical protein
MKTKTIYIQFKLLSGTQTYKVAERLDPPRTQPQNAKEYRYFEIESEKEVPEHLANQYPEKDMMIFTKWRPCESVSTEKEQS